MKTEDLGFQAIASFQTKLTLVEGAALVGGAVVAAGLGYLGSSSAQAEKVKKPRKITPKMIEGYRSQIFDASKGFKPVDQEYLEETFSDDDVLADAIRAGIAPKEAFALGANLELVPDDPSDPLYRKKVDGLKRITTDVSMLDWLEHFGDRLEEDDLAKIVDLPLMAFDNDAIFEFKMKGPKGFQRTKGVDWEQTMDNLAYIESLPRDVLDETVPFVKWLDGWIEDEMDNVYKVAALRPILEKTKSGRDLLAHIRESYFWGPLPDELSELLDKGVHLLKEGTFQKFVDAVEKSDQGSEGSEYVQKLDEKDLIKGILLLAKYEDALGPWKSYVDLLSAFDKLEAQSSDDDEETNGLLDADHEEDVEESQELEETGKITPKDDARFFDRYAQLDPEWAIQAFPYEYERGKRVAPIIRNVVLQIEKMVEDGEHVVIHGRDGELLYTMLTQTPGLDLSRVHYAITSRPLTTEASKVSERFLDYLKRSIPKNAIHIDTGFEGSIPKWLDKRGFGIKSVRLVSANNPSEQFQSSLAPEFLRHIVLRDLEHSPQRLRTPRLFEKMRFSRGAPGYWARYFGVRDALRLPRFTSQGASKFEKRRYLANLPKEEAPRYRIAETPKEEVSVEEETPSFAKMVK